MRDRLVGLCCTVLSRFSSAFRNEWTSVISDLRTLVANTAQLPELRKDVENGKQCKCEVDKAVRSGKLNWL